MGLYACVIRKLITEKLIYSSATISPPLAGGTLGALRGAEVCGKAHCHPYGAGPGRPIGSSHLPVPVCSLQITGCVLAVKHTRSCPPGSLCYFYIHENTEVKVKGTNSPDLKIFQLDQKTLHGMCV